MVEKEYTVVFSGDGGNACLAVNEEAYDEIYADDLLNDDYAKRMKEFNLNNYVKLKDGSRLYDINLTDMLDFLPEKSPYLKGYRLKLSFEPLTDEDVESGWFE